MAQPLDEDRTVWRCSLGWVNAYLVDDGSLTLVDAGERGSGAALRAEIREAGYDPAAIDRVLVTHFDPDHVGGLAGLEVAAPIYAHEPDASYLEGTARPPLFSRKGLLQRLIARRLTRPDDRIVRLEDGSTVGGFTAYHTPGHTPGHAAYHHPGKDLLLLGDLAVADDGDLTLPAWYYAYDGDRAAASVRALAERALAVEIACPGHGRPITAGGGDALAALADRLRE